MKLANSNSTRQKSPWYLKKAWIYVMCLVLPPIGIINVLIHQNYWQRDEQIEYAGLIIITGSLWMLKFFPFWMSIVFIILVLFCIYVSDLAELMRR